ncbi:MAG: recombinase family protein, partial [Rubrobacteraceae bacterium]|nr:recombinase family protein [Rubrobacteraceae bacterium]
MNGAEDYLKAILYARVSTAKQARGGYSLAQQMEALRGYAAKAGYLVLAEITDAGHSATTLQRPGMDRLRDLVAGGGVSVVLIQDLDRLVRDPEHLLLLRQEFRGRGCNLVALHDRGASEARLARNEVAKTSERSLRGKLRKAREGKILAGTTPNYGFRFNEARDGYQIDGTTMRVVRRIFRMLGVEKRTLHAIKRTLEAENVPTPTGKVRWSTHVIRGFVLNDVYRPHTFGEIVRLVTPEVAAELDRDRRYGVWWFNRERWTIRQVPDLAGESRLYRRSVRAVPKPKEEWVAVPVPDPGVPRECVDAARDVLRSNRWNTGGDARFWELSGGILRCGSCESRMRTCVTRKKPDRLYFYYACAKHHKERDACPNRRSYRAEALESAVWRAVSELLADPGRVREGFEASIRRERHRARGEHRGEERALLERLAEVDRMRRGYQAMAARGLMTHDELRERLEELGAARSSVLAELEAISDHLTAVQSLERERDALLAALAGSRPGFLDASQPEERHQIYLALRLAVVVGQDGTLAASGIPG